MASNIKIFNKKAYFDYQISETFEAGLVLTGSEVKAARAKKVSLNGTFVRPLSSGGDNRNEFWLVNANFAGTPEPDRSRKLLLHKAEIDRLVGQVKEKGVTLVPISLYFKRGQLKLEVGLARGKKQYEKRDTIKKRDSDRDIRRSLRR